MGLELLDVRIRQRDYLLSIAQAMVSRLNVRAVLRLILQAAAEMLQGQAGLVALKADEGLYTFMASYGLPPATVDAFQPLVESVPEVEHPDDFAIPDLGEKLLRINEDAGLLLRQVVALPMVAERELTGVIFIFRSESLRFSPDDRQILSSFADYAAIAVSNARSYEAAVTERRRLDTFLESSAEGILVLGPDRMIERFNRASAGLTGWLGSEAMGRPHAEVITWARLSSRLDLEQAVAEGWPGPDALPVYVEGDLRRRNGSVISVGITYAPLVARSGRLLNIIGTMQDLTRFRETDKLKDTFISVVSHELKTPIAIIKGYAETLRRPEARADAGLADEMLGSIVEEADRLARLVDDLLDVSRLQAGGLSFREVEEVDLRSIAGRVAERYRPQMTLHTLTLEFPEDFPAVQGDGLRLEQVLDNLVSNAIKYSPKGGHILIRGEVQPAGVVVAVSDQGVGIPLEDQERIFERFYRSESPDTRAVAGTGLGLYLARAIVEAHGGRCWVQSVPGEGSTFFVAIPRETRLVVWHPQSAA